MRQGIVASLALCAVLASCGDGDDAKGVLQEDDLPKVSKVSDIDNVPSVAVCSAINEAQFKLTIGNKPEGVGRAYTLDNGDQVFSSALGRSSSYGTLQKGLDAVIAAITECGASGTAGGEALTPIMGLESGVVGYTAVSAAADPPQFGARVFTIQGDRIIVVGTKHEGAGESSVDVVDLLPTALDRAKDAPKD